MNYYKRHIGDYMGDVERTTDPLIKAAEKALRDSQFGRPANYAPHGGRQSI